LKQVITRKDNITYTREIKEPKNYKQNINIRIDENTLETFKCVAKQKGISYSELLRKLMIDYSNNFIMRGE